MARMVGSNLADQAVRLVIVLLFCAWGISEAVHLIQAVWTTLLIILFVVVLTGFGLVWWRAHR